MVLPHDGDPFDDEPCGAFDPLPDAPIQRESGERLCRCSFPRERHAGEADNYKSGLTEMLMAAAIKHDVPVDVLLTRLVAAVRPNALLEIGRVEYERQVEIERKYGDIAMDGPGPEPNLDPELPL